MTTYNTRNPLGSSAAKDLYDNAQNFDHLSNDRQNKEWNDRFGVSRLTWWGMEENIKTAITNLGWNPVGTFQDGSTVTAAGDIIQDESTGVWYRWDDLSTLPKTVPAGSTPDSTGGTGEGKWLAVDVSDVLRKELAGPLGSWSVGKSNNLQNLINFDVRNGFVYETEGYYSPGDGGGARYLISSTQGEIPELAYLCDNGLYAILQHNGTISIEQLGGKGVLVGESATEDSWDAFFKAYKIKRSNMFSTNIEFVLTKNAYLSSKPVLLCSGMVLRTPSTSWVCKVFYGGQTVTESEVPDVPGIYSTDGVVKYSTIHAQAMFVHSTNLYCYYATLNGVQFRNANSVSTSNLYGIYAPYCSKVNLLNCRFEKVFYGMRWIDFWGGAVKQVIFLGVDTNTSPQNGTIGLWGEPYLGISAFESGGTSNVFECVGTSGFQSGIKITRMLYSSFNSCYSEKGNDRAFEFISCDGITINSFGLENLVNTIFSCLRFSNTRATINNLCFAYNNTSSGGNGLFSANGSKVNVVGISFGRLQNTGTTFATFNVDATSELGIDGPVDIPSSLISSTGYGFATVNGKLFSDNVFSGSLGIANGSSTVNAVTFTTNELSYKFSGGSMWFNYIASWTGGSGSDFQVFGFPRTLTKDCLINAVCSSTTVPVYGRTLLASNRFRISASSTAANVPIPATGTLLLQGGGYNIT
ncbi:MULTISPECIES: hypothetical protein [unclassified Pseudocitrobacter]|uniref:tail fiber/spike domain-containing protein n=1 Tax=unclassified Pseudocitrobacter TaxID=2638778 RepID=UPI0023E405CC|nr:MULTISPECIES: hypothetical protein [unclassified Pseudocitrobacter]MDF3830166.1 hypothetical protein [Pseudocitrobacter sp. 2023EL-00150]MEC5376676.1 hypothetical protein [Pseudocitrobacter sp. MW920760]